jgi:hypothetical protein
MAFVCHGTDSSSYWLLEWDRVSIPTIELLKLLSCYLHDDLLDLCFVLLFVVYLLLVYVFVYLTPCLVFCVLLC